MVEGGKGTLSSLFYGTNPTYEGITLLDIIISPKACTLRIYHDIVDYDCSMDFKRTQTFSP